MTTDVAGQDWLVTHGLDRTDPYVAGRENARHLMINRLDWIDGWPVARAGAGLPDGPVPAPEATATVADAFETGDAPGGTWEPAAGWTVRRDAAGGHLHADDEAGTLRSVRAAHDDTRARTTVRLAAGESGSAGIRLADHDDGGGVRIGIDRQARALVAEVRLGAGTVSRVVSELPETFQYQGGTLPTATSSTASWVPRGPGSAAPEPRSPTASWPSRYSGTPWWTSGRPPTTPRRCCYGTRRPGSGPRRRR
ncbi:MAG: hypothetical protein ACRDTU_12880 [Micromonosporaceae bacterium]